ncbi:BTB/POZ domain-containing protein 6-B-like [Paramacrobiotus metropolitanus]|uniref:BTB/POZ domain-containing protein 6-B-like n=1 Tax=Paramacrobiotus metropolitanus TaxID=2943436 RepID=UPI002446079B|nr:BTB/POZ domain-containing protein 6-B-like [Paramacrobiotus metropolitanus]
MLSYLYTYRVDLNRETVFPTLYCADRYDVPGLVDACFQFAICALEARTCLMHLGLAVEWQAAVFVEPCLKVIDVHAETVLHSEYFKTLDKRTLELILPRCTLQAKENSIYEAVAAWAEAACIRNNEEPNAANRRRMLGGLLFLVRFPLMSEQELQDGPVAGGLLLSTELLDLSLTKHAAAQSKKPPFSAQPRQMPSTYDGNFCTLPDTVTVVLRRGEDGQLGFSIVSVGGNGKWAGDKPIFVKTIEVGGRAYDDGRLQPGDLIMPVNGQSLKEATHDRAASVLRNAGNVVVLDVIHVNLYVSAHHSCTTPSGCSWIVLREKLGLLAINNQ